MQLLWSLITAGLYAFCLWMGLYLLARNLNKLRLRLTAFGLLTYALALGVETLRPFVSEAGEIPLSRLGFLLALLPSLFWSGAMIQLLPENDLRRESLSRIWGAVYLPTTLIVFVIAGSTDLVFPVRGNMLTPGFLVMAGLVLVPLLGSFGLVGTALFPARERTGRSLALMATLFFGLGLGIFIFPLAIFPRPVALLAIGFDLILMGVAIAGLDALEEGETLRPDMLHSLIVTGFTMTLFGGQVVLASLFTGVSMPLVLLLLSTLAASAGLYVFLEPLQSLWDKVVLRRSPDLIKKRRDLRQAAESLTRLDQTIDLEKIDGEEFNRLTRRALSHFNDLGKLTSNPLLHLSLIDSRLDDHVDQATTLERAAILRELLAESIERLRPPSYTPSRTGDEWRHYNVLFYPYVRGIKVLSRRAVMDEFDPTTREVVIWFRADVPERTLHNWQNAAARLVALDLREQAEAER